ncbi:MAG: hypothetical protein Q4G13_03220 [Moraxella sp.]|nr:hypothetical protein [Moraxella sp.]
MAQRPIFIPSDSNSTLVETKMIDFTYHAGFSVSQKQKNIQELHSNASNSLGLNKILEVSSKSLDELGVKLSAFNLMIQDKSELSYSVECAFQSSKVFEQGQFKDLLYKTSREAKKDERLKTSGKLLSFNFYGNAWELNPVTAFYDWLYISAINQNKHYHKEILSYQAFTDIEFNPKKSINCQAYSLAMFVSLYNKGLLDVLSDKQAFLALYTEYKTQNTQNQHDELKNQELF